MNVGIDIDATITETPELFAVLSHALRDAGHRVYVVSCRDPAGLDESRAEVDGYGISYDDIFHPQDHEDIPQFKARMARELELDIFFDDMPESARTYSGGTGLQDLGQETFEADSLTRRETLELVRAYYRITDPKVRKRLFELAKSLANMSHSE